MSNQELLRATIALQESNMGMLEQENEDLRRKLAKLGNESVILPDGKDLGDMTDAEVEKVVEKWM